MGTPAVSRLSSLHFLQPTSLVRPPAEPFLRPVRLIPTALAALRGYICHVLVDDNCVTNVSYVSSDNSSRWPDYLQRRERIEGLRAAAAAAARMGVFRLDNKQRASELAEHSSHVF